MNEDQLNDYVKKLLNTEEITDDVVLLFILNSIKKNDLDLREVTEALTSTKKNLDILQKKYNGVLFTRVAYINDIKNRVREIKKGGKNEK